ncbi:MAG TPA: isoprenylcysteine carboxylmethyltransferase family protein [Candidatus Kapabacteria bacterium]|nr:isoprenylcysteine carboxylmethyltransferase family protein [Candidatus Kapabacteria bacterium]HPO62421.1 isoprenylcysteine carboxylmethyltransferase family protein [Candidatus Kapabacteria bacterium]
MKNFNRIFGSGPLGLIFSLVLFFVANFLNNYINIPQIFWDNTYIHIYIFAFLTLITIIMIVWSFKSLNPNDRGKTLITTGMYKYFRHPLYAAFLSVFNFGLAILMNNWIFIIWAILLHPIWHLLVKSEEKMLKEVFPNDYEEYCKKTGRFFPKLRLKK